ncbi:MAG: MarR family transcriptional regulator [Oscillospiraceae bacterium]|nr:MarR family transcriptional regulator [Oscillospiraceae bacterium]
MIVLTQDIKLMLLLRRLQMQGLRGGCCGKGRRGEGFDGLAPDERDRERALEEREGEEFRHCRRRGGHGPEGGPHGEHCHHHGEPGPGGCRKDSRGFGPQGPHKPGRDRLLALLAEEDGIAQRELLERADIRPSSLSEALDKLQKEGLIERRENSDDRRESLVFLTEDGRALAVRMQERLAARAEALFAPLSEQEKTQLFELLNKLLETERGV